MNTQTTSPTTTPFSQPYILPNDDVSPHVHNTQHTSPSSSTSSLIIVMIVISSAIILTATIYFTIRYISRRTSNSVNDVVSVNVNINNEHVTEISNNRNDVDSLPLFKFSSLTGNMMTSGDCAVCLSKFESEDQLRLLPLCCHAFHALCIDAWLKSNFTCPLCRSNVNPTEADISRATGTGTGASRSNSFRIEIGSISNRREPSGSRRRSYSVGSFEYVVDIDGYEVSVESTRLRGESDHGDKEVLPEVVPGPGENVAAEVGSGRRSWLRRSLRGSERLFSTGSSRRSENVADDRIGEEISEFFRWFSGV